MRSLTSSWITHNFTNSIMTSSIEKLASEMINCSVGIAKRGSLCHGNNTVDPRSHQAMIQLVTPGPRLTKFSVKNRGVWEGALIIWYFFPELICITVGPHRTGLAVQQVAVPRKGWGLSLDCIFTFLWKWPPNLCDFKTFHPEWKGEATGNSFKSSHNGSICSRVWTPRFKQIVQAKKKKNNPKPQQTTSRTHCQEKASIPSKVLMEI